MLRRCLVGFLCCYTLMKWWTKLLLSCLKFAMVPEGILLNQTLAAPFSVVEKALHITSYRVICRCIKVLKDLTWSKRFFEQSYGSSWGRQNFVGRGWFNTSVVNGESIPQIIPSRFSMDFSFMALLSSSISLLMLQSSLSILDEFSFEALVFLWFNESAVSSSLLFFYLFSFLWSLWALAICLSSEFCRVSSLTLVVSAWICCATWVESIWYQEEFFCKEKGNYMAL